MFYIVKVTDRTLEEALIMVPFALLLDLIYLVKRYIIPRRRFRRLPKNHLWQYRQINIGDILWTSGHCKVVSSVNVDEDGIYNIVVTEQGGYNIVKQFDTIKMGLRKSLKG